MSWFIFLLIIWIAGYLLNRTVFWIGAFLWNWCENIWFCDRWWYYPDTTIKDIIGDIKYKDPDDPRNSWLPDYKDSYDAASFSRWIPILNMTGIIIGLLMITGFILTLIIQLIKYILIGIIYVIRWLWDICLHYIWEFIVKIIKKIIYSSIVKSIFNFIQNIRDRILNFKVS